MRKLRPKRFIVHLRGILRPRRVLDVSHPPHVQWRQRWDYPTPSDAKKVIAVDIVEHSIEHESVTGGFSTVDEKGRVSLPKPVREALGVHAGSTVAYLVLDGALVVIPQDTHLSALMDRAQQALAAAGMTARDLLDALPTAQAEVVTEAYGAEFLNEMERLRTQVRDE